MKARQCIWVCAKGTWTRLYGCKWAWWLCHADEPQQEQLFNAVIAWGILLCSCVRYGHALGCVVDFCSFYFIRRCQRCWRTRRVEGFSAVSPAVADQSNTDAEGTAAFRTLVNFLVRWQEDYLKLAQLAFPLSELLLFCSAQRGQCLCWFCSAEGLWEKRNICKIWNAFIVIKFTIIRFYLGVETLGINWAYDSSRPYK